MLGLGGVVAGAVGISRSAISANLHVVLAERGLRNHAWSRE